MNIVIVGGGVMGLVSAWRLALQNHTVTLLEKGKCGHGASMASPGVLMPYAAHHEKEIAVMQRESLALYPNFIKELFDKTGIDPAYKQTGRIQPIQSEQQYNNLKEDIEIACRNWNWVGKGQVQEIITPEQSIKRDPELETTEYGALFCRATSQVIPVHLVSSLRSACLKAGVDVREGCHVDRLKFGDNGKVCGVFSGHGPIEADVVVIAAGAWSQKLLPIDQQLVKPVKGQSLILKSGKSILNYIARVSGVYILQLPGERIYVGATKEYDTGLDLETTEEACDQLLEKAEKWVPILAECKLENQWVGLRPASTIGKPICGDVEGVEGLKLISGHGGIGICMVAGVAKQVDMWEL